MKNLIKKMVKKIKDISKKAVSPMVATVLLVAFVVSIGALVMNWAKSYVQETTRFASDKSNREVQCSLDVKISLVTLDDIEQICYNKSDGQIFLMIENGPVVPIDHIEVRVIRADKTTKMITLTDSSLGKGEAKSFRFYYANVTLGETTDITEVRIMPAIVPPGTSQVVLCSNSAIVRAGSEIRECSEI